MTIRIWKTWKSGGHSWSASCGVFATEEIANEMIAHYRNSMGHCATFEIVIGESNNY